MKECSWNLDEEDASYIMQIGDKRPYIGVKKLTAFYKKYIGKEADLENKTRSVNLMQQEKIKILGDLKQQAEEKINIFEKDLKEREDILKKKEAIWIVLKSAMDGIENGKNV